MTDTARTLPREQAVAKPAIEKRQQPKRPVRRTILYAALIITSLAMIGPFYWAFATSFKPSGDVFASPPKLIPNPWTVQNYRDVFTLLPFPRYFLNSVIVTGTIVALNVVFDTAAAYAFAKLRFPGRNALFFLLLITLMVPFQVNLIPLYRLMVALHNISPLLGVDTYSALILPGMIQVFGIFLMRQFLQSIPDEILESARVDGASEFMILRKIVFPIAAPGMAALAIFVFLGAWNDFLWPLIVTNSDSIRTLPVGLALLARKNTVNWGDTMAGTVLAAAPLIVVFLILQRRFIEGLTTGSVKG
ncbi:MAG TPA: carbohydrate ABC transporter permease [Actinomycetota bacterium]|jgi:multiple sugar transport system permease protein|nr:carbohydrate ABC transporter permease [Actinomycetota bacterium]